MPGIIAILPAAGMGTRMGGESPKQFRLLDGVPLLVFTLRRLAACPSITEFLIATKIDPGPVHRLLRIITDFLKQWHVLQRETFPSIDGIMVLDDIVGFISEEDFVEFGLPYLKELYATDVAVKLFHNDAPCAQSVRHYAGLGINLFNPGIQDSLTELRQLSGHRLTILGNIPPRDVLAQGTPADVRAAVRQLLAETKDHSRLILSCAGGMPPGVSTENIRAFIQAVESFNCSG